MNHSILTMTDTFTSDTFTNRLASTRRGMGRFAGTLRNAITPSLMLVLAVGGLAPASLAGPDHPHPLVVAAKFEGLVTGALEGANVRLTADGTGEATQLGRAAASVTWAPAIQKLVSILTGEVKQVTITGGEFLASFENGSSVLGTLEGTIHGQGKGRFLLVGDVTITGGTGDLAGATGKGMLIAQQDVPTRKFDAQLYASLRRP